MGLREGIASGLKAFSYADPNTAQLDQTRQELDLKQRAAIASLVVEGVRSGLIKDQSEAARVLKNLGPQFEQLTIPGNAPPAGLEGQGGGPPTPEQAEAQRTTIFGPEAQKPPGTLKERAMQTVIDAKKKIREGQPLTQEEKDRVAGARYLLETESTGFKTGPGGELRLESVKRQLPEELAIGPDMPATSSEIIRQKSLATKDRDDLLTRKEMSDKLTALDNNFKDDYVGYVSDILGDASIAAQKRFGDSPEFNDWWQSYQDFVNEVRHEKFGAALTATEKKEFLKAMITPGMKASLARKNLARQKALVETALKRKTKALKAAQFNEEEIMAIVENQPTTEEKTSIAKNIDDPRNLEGFDQLSPDKQQRLIKLYNARRSQ